MRLRSWQGGRVLQGVGGFAHGRSRTAGVHAKDFDPSRHLSFIGKNLAQTLQREFRRRVCAPVGTARSAHAGRGVDDAGPSAGIKQIEQSVVEQEHGVDVGLHNALPLLHGVVGDGSLRPKSRGVVDDAVQAAEGFVDGLGQIPRGLHVQLF